MTTASPGVRVALIAAGVLSVLGLATVPPATAAPGTAPAAVAGTDRTQLREEPWSAEKPQEFFCEKTPRSDQFYAAWAAAQNLRPYNTKNDVAPPEEARRLVFGSADLNDGVRDRICGPDAERYQSALRDVIADVKAEIKPEYATEAALEKFNEDKLAALTKACLDEENRG